MWKYSIRMLYRYADHKDYYPIYNKLSLLETVEKLTGGIDTPIYNDLISNHQTTIMYRIINNAIFLHIRIPKRFMDRIVSFLADRIAHPNTAYVHGNYTMEEIDRLYRIIDEYKSQES